MRLNIPAMRRSVAVGAFMVGCLAAPAQAQVLRRFTGIVTDSVSGESIARVSVSINGEQKAVTAPDGTFDFAVPIPGADPDMITFRRIGYAEWTGEVRVGDRPAVFLPVSLSPLPVGLAEIIVEGERVLVSAKLKLSGFYWRREREQGRFITEEDIDKMVAQRVTDVFQRVPGINYFPPLVAMSARWVVSSSHGRGAPRRQFTLTDSCLSTLRTTTSMTFSISM